MLCLWHLCQNLSFDPLQSTALTHMGRMLGNATSIYMPCKLHDVATQAYTLARAVSLTHACTDPLAMRLTAQESLVCVSFGAARLLGLTTALLPLLHQAQSTMCTSPD